MRGDEMDKIQKFRRAGVILALLSAVTMALSAAGEREADHHDEEESIPQISLIPLESGEKLRVVATTTIVGDVVRNVGQDGIALEVLIGPGQDPHSYKPTSSAMAKLESAHIVFTNGFGLEEGLLDLIESNAKGYVVPISAGIDPVVGHDDHGDHDEDHDQDHDDDHDGDEDHEDDHDDEDGHDDHEDNHEHGPLDPHVWFDPTNVLVWIENVEHVLSEANPALKAIFAKNAEGYSQQVMELDRFIRDRSSELEPELRRFAVDHQVFTYFTDEYGFEIEGFVIPAGTTTADVSARQIADLVEELKEHSTSVVVIGETAGKALRNTANAVVRELGDSARVVELLTGSLTGPDGPGDTYIEYMRYNVEQLISALKGIDR